MTRKLNPTFFEMLGKKLILVAFRIHPSIVVILINGLQPQTSALGAHIKHYNVQILDRYQNPITLEQNMCYRRSSSRDSDP